MIIITLLVGVLVLFLILLATGPLESLTWWSDQGADQAVASVDRFREAQAASVELPEFESYVVYLSGIGAIDGTSKPEEEKPLLDGLREQLPKVCVIDDVFPYAMDESGLTAQRPLARMWRAIERMRLKNPETLLGMLINLRNAIQLFVCADRRYGPTYNIGTAKQVMEALLKNGYRLDSGVPVTLVGWSGGAQISLGAAWYLGMARIPLRVISIGGMMSDDYGLDRIQHLHHLRGSKDPFEKLGWVMFAGRWPIAVNSPWSNAVKEHRIDVIDIGPMAHNVKEHYFDSGTLAPDGRSYIQVTTDAVVALLKGEKVKDIPGW